MKNDRRTFLRGLGVSLALPAFETFAAPAKASGKASRFVCISPNYGVYPGHFFPEATGEDYQLPGTMSALEAHRDDFSIFSNMDHPGVGGGHGCSNTFLNGVEMKDTKDMPTRLHSLDQTIAFHIGKDTRFPSLLMGSGGISWTRAGTILPTLGNPTQIFNKLFVDDHPKTKAQTRKFLEEDASILDVVMEDAKKLGHKLSTADQTKLEEYLTSVREVEVQIQRQGDWIDIPKPKADDTVIKGSDELVVDLAYPYNTPVMYDLMLLALQTDSTRVICFGHPGGNRLFPFDGISLGYHTLTHHGKRPELLDELAIIEKYYIDEFAKFLGKLKSTKDARGESLFDSTSVLFGSGMGNASSHSSRNLPTLLAGGGFRHGQHHTFPRHGRDGRPLSDLFVSILQGLGIEADSFSTSGGNLNHLLA